MDAYTIMVIVLGAGMISMGVMLYKKISIIRSTPDEEKSGMHADIQHKLRQQLDALEDNSDNKDENAKIT
ncbi:MAG TPA: hypothetical protein VIL52_02550 [Bacteroidota bacterium]